MPGAIIPNDWDGSTYECRRVVWPSSDQWLALLMGQVTEPTFEDFWDKLSGDVDQAVEDTEEAEILTLPDFYSVECDEMPNPPAMSFRAIFNGSDQTIPTAETTELEFWVTQWDVGDAGFDESVFGHKIDKEEQAGWWNYNIAVRIDTTTNFVLLGLKNGSVVARSRVLSQLQCRLSFDYDMLLVDDVMSVAIFITGGADAGASLLETWFSGHRITPEV